MKIGTEREAHSRAERESVVTIVRAVRRVHPRGIEVEVVRIS